MNKSVHLFFFYTAREKNLGFFLISRPTVYFRVDYDFFNLEKFLSFFDTLQYPTL